MSFRKSVSPPVFFNPEKIEEFQVANCFNKDE